MAQSQSIQPKPSPVAATSAGLLQFWHWWSAELKVMLPSAMANWLDGGVVAINVSVDAQTLTIIDAIPDTAKASQITRVPIDAMGSNVAVRELIATGRDHVRLVLTPDQAMVKTISLPMATEENLREVVGFELDRHTPFTPAQAYYDVQIARRDPQQEKIAVTLVVASKIGIAALTDTLRRAGLTCSAIGIDNTAAINAAAFDLQPVLDKPLRKLSRAHQLNIGLFAVAVLLILATIVLPIWQKREAIKVLNPQAEMAGVEFQISERIYTEYVNLAAEYNFLAARKHTAYPALTVLEELAKTFPDTTWVQKLDIKANGKVREVRVMVEAQSASKVIENLEQSPLSLFQNSKQVTQSIRTQPNTERVDVSAEIKQRPLPIAEGIDETTGSSASIVIPASAAEGSNVEAAKSVTTPTQTAQQVQPTSAAAQDQASAKVGAAPAARTQATPTPTATGPAAQAPSTAVPAPSTPLAPPLTTLNAPPSAAAQFPPTMLSAPNVPVHGPLTTLNAPPSAQSPPTMVPVPSTPPTGKRGSP